MIEILRIVAIAASAVAGGVSFFMGYLAFVVWETPHGMPSLLRAFLFLATAFFALWVAEALPSGGRKPPRPPGMLSNWVTKIGRKLNLLRHSVVPAI